MFCRNCGQQVSEYEENCTNCGFRVRNSVMDDNPNWPVNILTLCCIPIVGLIMYFVWKNEKPKAAKSALIFFFIHIGIVVLFYALAIIIGISFSTF